MSPELTFRQKLIRIGSSAAICGLSISFILGEAVDSKAKELRAWQQDSTLLPTDYLPLHPLAVTLNSLEQPGWRDQLVASNSLSIPLEPSLLKSTTIQDAKIKFVSASPELASPVVPPAPVIRKSPAELSAKVAAPLEMPLESAEVEKLLSSIHEATARLAGGSRDPENILGVNTEGRSKVPDLMQATAPLRQRPAKASAFIAVSEAPSYNKGLGQDRVIEAPMWSLAGRILSSTAQPAEPGHFEVALFSKVTSDGKPLGYPLTQQFLPTGQTSFRLEVPAQVEKGYLFAEFVAAKGNRRTLISPAQNPFSKGVQQVAELVYQPEDTVSSVAAAATRTPPAAAALLAEANQQSETWRVQGSVSTMFVTGSKPIAQSDVIVRVRGRREAARTDSLGNFFLDLPRLKGTLFLEVVKAGYHPAIIQLAANDTRHLQVELASRHAIDQISQRIGSTQASSKGIFVGRVQGADGKPLKGVTAQISVKADGPFYFDDEGNLTREARSTSSNGRFLFLNVDPGTGYLETFVGGEAIAPIQISSVEGGELIQKTLVPVSGTLRGRIFNPVADSGKMETLIGARVRIDGASDWVSTDSYGAFSIGPLKWMRDERIALEVTAAKFNNHRYLVSVDETSSMLNLFAFPARYVARLAQSMDVDLDPYAGVVIGKVTGTSLRLDALADHSNVNNARDFYFDGKGRLRGSHEMTDSKFGTYIIFNVPKGRTILQGNDGGGVMRYSEALYTNASSINVQMD